MLAEFFEQSQRLTAVLRGRMEAADGDEFATTVERRIRPDIQSLTIDLDQLEFISFGGIRALLRLARSLAAADKELDFIHGNHAVRDALDQAGLDDFFPFTPPYISVRGTR